MAELMSVHGWAYPPLNTPPGSQDTGQKRVSRSTDGRGKPPPGKTVFRAKSSNALTDMATVANAFRPSPSLTEESAGLNTLKDPRAASTSDLSSTATSGDSPRHPELSNEVATLSDKLIQAINNQTILDDTLSATRQELEAVRAKNSALEQENRRYKDDLASGRVVKKGEVEVELSLMRETAEDERSKRLAMEKEKKGIEQELENLTAALFDEANNMVAAAGKEREAVEHKNELLRAQIRDTEMLVASHQEQLAELKSTMEKMHNDRDDADTRTNPSTAPASPATANTQQHDSINRLLEAMNLSPTTPGSPDISPAPSTSFGHLIKSVCRTDVNAYDDFRALHQQAKSSRIHSRAGSGSYGGLGVMGLSNFTNNNSSPHLQPQTNGISAASNRLSQASYTNGLTSPSPRDSLSSSIPLKETKFYKRVLTEDIEPTLRLDTAPGISWLTRRSVMSSICEGGLIIEPIPSATQRLALPCSMCGERRKSEDNPRTHRFRTSDSESAQRYPLCIVCLERMRATCDFVGYLRLIVDSHLRVEDDEDERESWEETVRLRERMFWSRIGGGVVPAFVQKREGEIPEEQPVNGDQELPAVPQAPEKRLSTEDADKGDDPFSSKAQRASIGNTVISINGQIEMSPSDTPEKEEETKGGETVAQDGAVSDSTPAEEEPEFFNAKEGDETPPDTTQDEGETENDDSVIRHEPATDTDEKEDEPERSDSIAKDEQATDADPPATKGDTQEKDTIPTSAAGHAKSNSTESLASSKTANGTGPALTVSVPQPSEH